MVSTLTMWQDDGRSSRVYKVLMRDGGQTSRNARPMIRFFFIGPNTRESAESPRLSPIMKYSPAGIRTGPKSLVVTPSATTIP